MGHPPRHLPSPPVEPIDVPVLHVLVVSHDDGLRELLSTHLRRVGHVVIPTDSGQLALDHLAATADPAPHVAIVDWTAPGLRARDLIHALKTRRPELWVIALSASQRRTHPRLIGWDQLIQKPFSMRTLVRSLAGSRCDAAPQSATRTSVTRIRRQGLATVT